MSKNTEVKPVITKMATKSVREAMSWGEGGNMEASAECTTHLIDAFNDIQREKNGEDAPVVSAESLALHQSFIGDATTTMAMVFGEGAVDYMKENADTDRCHLDAKLGSTTVLATCDRKRKFGSGDTETTKYGHLHLNVKTVGSGTRGAFTSVTRHLSAKAEDLLKEV